MWCSISPVGVKVALRSLALVPLTRGTVKMCAPPGFKTLPISRKAALGSKTCSMTSWVTNRPNCSSSNVRRSRSSQRQPLCASTAPMATSVNSQFGKVGKELLDHPHQSAFTRNRTAAAADQMIPEPTVFCRKRDSVLTDVAGSLVAEVLRPCGTCRLCALPVRAESCLK